MLPNKLLLLFFFCPTLTRQNTFMDQPPCKHGRIEFADEATPRPYCMCEMGWSGHHCDLPAFCGHGRELSDSEEPLCQCDEGYSGRRCEIIECENGGTPTNTSICICPPWFKGRHCGLCNETSMVPPQCNGTAATSKPADDSNEKSGVPGVVLLLLLIVCICIVGVVVNRWRKSQATGTNSGASQVLLPTELQPPHNAASEQSTAVKIALQVREQEVVRQCEEMQSTETERVELKAVVTTSGLGPSYSPSSTKTY